MTVYPDALDTDAEIEFISDNLSEMGAQVINQIREALFAIEGVLGVSPAGSAGDVAAFLAVAHQANGHLKASELSGLGLVTLPITNIQVGDSAGIAEYKLDLTYSTSDLHTLIVSNSNLLTSLNSFTNTIFGDFNLHLAGANLLSDGSTSARHVISQIDLNAIPFDARHPSYTWSGLRDKDGNLRSATQAAQALQQINDDLVSHENGIVDAHPASAIVVDTDAFQEIPVTADTAQKVFDYLDQAEVISLGQHRATQHANGIPVWSRANSLLLDGYQENLIPPTTVYAYLTHPPNVTPVDDLSVGDDIIKFVAENSGFTFDAAFSRVRPGDLVRINYANGLESTFPIESIRFLPGVEWLVRINGVNLCEQVDGYAMARIDRAPYNTSTAGVLAVAAANARDASGPIYTTILSSVTVGSPRGASALGLGFDPNQLDSTHYKLYLQLFPTGNPQDRIINLPAVDVTGNAGATPGKYTLDSVVQATNDKLREIGYNLRFIAFAFQGQFGIMLADAINSASFSIISGSNSTGTLLTSGYTENVIGGNALDSFDPLGLGTSGADLASPAFQDSWLDATAAMLPTKVFTPLKQRYYHVNGQKLDRFEPTYLANDDGYWDGYISARTPIGITNVEVTYSINLDLAPAGLRPGKTLVIQPTVDFSDPLYNDVDYGRFIIKNVNFIQACGSVNDLTEITVINGLHAYGSGFGFSAAPQLPVRIYFSADSVGFDSQNLIDSGISSADYIRYHEILVSDIGKTFAHERARFPRQTETTSLLGTTNWHVRSVSPKLRGYRDGSATVFNKYLRFYCLSYDSSTGEYDGYLGQRLPAAPGILRTGPVITGRKNLSTRFYDETGVDYLDLLFQDDNVSPGVNVLSNAVPRYVDVELFPSLQTDDEMFLLASCEVNWDPVANANIVQQVQDRRQFGSVDEEDFTQSAQDFISAADKYLHQNGVVRGLDYDSTGTNGQIFFKGGVALVSGRMVTMNNSSVTIPQIYDTSSGTPQNLTWVICANAFGQLTAVILTTVKDQTFMTTGASNYYVPSVTWDELVNTRMDLCPIATASVTIASITINSVTDARKMIVAQDGVAPLVWTQSSKTLGNFFSFTALKNWLNLSAKSSNAVHSFRNLVKVRGTFNLAVGATAYDLTGLTQPVIFDGEEAVFNIAANVGFTLGSNVTLRNFTFNYSGTGTAASATSLINGSGPAGCLYGASGTSVSRLKIENCLFRYASPTQRPPFIFLELVKEQINSQIEILSNSFEETGASTDLAQSQAAIVIRTLNSGGGTLPAVLINSRISHNYCNYKQGIFVTSVASSGVAATPGLNVYATEISHNTCGMIGVVASSVVNTLATLASLDLNTGLTISQNTCQIIGPFYGNGDEVVDAGDLGYGTGNVEIIHNRCHWVAYQASDITASNQYSHTVISSNSLQAANSTYLSLFTPVLPNYAINVFDFSDLTSSEVMIESNKIDFGRVDGVTYGYDRGIACSCSATVSHNIIKGMNTSARGIRVSADGGGNSTKRYLVTGNKIYRGSVSITNFISVPGTNGAHEGVVVENYFDSHTIDGSDTIVINNVPTGWTIARNKNQTQVATIAAASGNWTLSGLVTGLQSIAGFDDSGVIITSVNLATVQHDSNADTSARLKAWNIPLLDVLPAGVKITAASFQYNVTGTDPDSGTVTAVATFTSGGSDTTGALSINPTGDQTVNLTIASDGLIRYGNAASEVTPELVITISFSEGSTSIIEVKNLTITYRY